MYNYEKSSKHILKNPPNYFLTYFFLKFKFYKSDIKDDLSMKKIWKIIFHMFGIHKLFPVLPVLLPDPAGWTSEFVKFDIKNELPIIKTSKPMYHTLLLLANPVFNGFLANRVPDPDFFRPKTFPGPRQIYRYTLQPNRYSCSWVIKSYTDRQTNILLLYIRGPVKILHFEYFGELFLRLWWS